MRNDDFFQCNICDSIKNVKIEPKCVEACCQQCKQQHEYIIINPVHLYDDNVLRCRSCAWNNRSRLQKMFEKTELFTLCESNHHKNKYESKTIRRCKDGKMRCDGCINEIQDMCKISANRYSKKEQQSVCINPSCEKCKKTNLVYQCNDDVFRCSECLLQRELHIKKLLENIQIFL